MPKRVDRQADEVARKGPNPMEKMQVGLKVAAPVRHIGTFPDAKGPIRGPVGSRTIHRITAAPRGTSNEA
jgi:hypothetical protein